jgi:hypothetical protein
MHTLFVPLHPQINIAAILFMWCTLPAFGAAAYIPSLVLGMWLSEVSIEWAEQSWVEVSFSLRTH